MKRNIKEIVSRDVEERDKWKVCYNWVIKNKYGRWDKKERIKRKVKEYLDLRR